ncbi:histone H4 transcription factor-like isoform X2 [Agrilus planipennis]|uniref:Histone H4 transcription factor-like isoform X2 n=1 Tax=Agrilus planipennis TaxID=224129 RepID=A0A1W4W5U5_AGRPL|nr:histone H4 transcription factor-like isoform X2 [Agrilus planipennis]
MTNVKSYPNRLAVFEHVPQEKSSSSKRFGRTASSLTDSDSDTQTDTIKAPRKRHKGVKHTEEPLSLMCMWLECPKVTEYYDEFIKHISTHVPTDDSESLLECQWSNCRFRTNIASLLDQHLVYHDCTLTPVVNLPLFEGGFVCEWKYCQGIYGNVFYFYNHIKQHVNCFPAYCSKNEIIECQWMGCSFKCSSQYKLADHLRSHTKEKMVACPTCEATFATKTKFYDHRKRQLPVEEQSYQCSQCTKMFPSERLLKDHIRSHVNHYKCPMCDMTCPKPSSLATHIRFRHFSERPVTCSLCEHRCVNKQDLLQHMLVHCSKSLFECEECNFSCRSMYGLDRHYQKEHDHEWTQTYECHVCKKTFHRGNHLTRHLIKTHGFHWPSGHSRFRYKVDPDGIYRLQTVRYESLEVTQEIINNSSVNKIEADTNYELKLSVENVNDIPKYEMVKEEPKQNILLPTNNSVLITINDVDESGNILKSEIIESSEVKLLKSEIGDVKSIQEEDAPATCGRVLRPRKKC